MELYQLTLQEITNTIEQAQNQILENTIQIRNDYKSIIQMTKKSLDISDIQISFQVIA